MQEPRMVAISVNNKFLTLEIRIKDMDLIESIMHGLADYVRKGCPIWIMRTFPVSFFDSSVEMISKEISKGEEMEEVLDDTKRLISSFLTEE